MKIFESHKFEVKAETSRAELLDGLKKFGIFSDVEFDYKDKSGDVFYVREVGVLERLAKIFRSISSKNLFHSSGDALLNLSKKNLVLAGILGRSVYDARIKPMSARALSEKLQLKQNKFKRIEGDGLSVPPEGKIIVTAALSKSFIGVRSVDLSKAVNRNNFYDDCKVAFCEAMKNPSGEVLNVKPILLSDDDEASDESIKVLLQLIDEHQQAHPDCRIMIATDGDQSLYQRVLDMKVRHDAVKNIKNHTSGLTALDLLCIPERGVDVVKLKPLDESRLSKIKTGFEGVYLCNTDYPHHIRSDLAIVDMDTVAKNTSEISASKDLMSDLINGIASPEIQQEFTMACKKTEEDSTIQSFRLPALDLSVNRLIVFANLRAQWAEGTPKYNEGVGKVKAFYLQALREERGRVVIESPVREYACEGLRQAIGELRGDNAGPAEIMIIADPASNDMRKFQQSIHAVATE